MTGTIGTLSLGSGVRSTELGRQQRNSGGRSAPDGIDVPSVDRGLQIAGSDRGRTATGKGSFTIVNIFPIVQRVLILRPPLPLPKLVH